MNVQCMLDGHLMLDPSASECERCSSSMTVACLPQTNEAAGVFIDGDFSAAAGLHEAEATASLHAGALSTGGAEGTLWRRAFGLGMAACVQLRKCMRDALIEAVNREAAASA